MSLASRMIGMHSISWFTVNTEPETVSYVDVNNVAPVEISMVLSAPQTVIRHSDDGHRSKVRIRKAVFYAADGLTSPNGLSEIALDAVLTTPNGEKWTIDAEAEEGIRSTTGNFHQISLKAITPMSRGYDGMINRGN